MIIYYFYSKKNVTFTILLQFHLPLSLWSEHSVPSDSLAKSEKQLSWGQVSGYVLFSRECFKVKVFLTHMETVWKCKSSELRHWPGGLGILGLLLGFLHNSVLILTILPLLCSLGCVPSTSSFAIPAIYCYITSQDMCVCVKSLQSCWIPCNPTDCSPPGSSVHGIVQARILEWVAMPSSRGSSQPRHWTLICRVSYIGRRVPYH